MQVVGIDVGGTNTDATLLSEDKRVLAMVKTPTDHSNILASTKAALNKILKLKNDAHPVQLHLSTTLSTNAIVEGKGDSTAVLALAGPGLNIADFGFNFSVYSIQGYVDHRGRIVKEIDREEILKVANQLRIDGTKSIAIVGKFSHRNNSLEIAVKELLETQGWFKVITLGHQLSGSPNFPRRIMSAYLNASVASIQANFVQMIEEIIKTNPIISDVKILKADGGTMGLKESCLRPIETILSGPAASIMAALALVETCADNAVVVDIGGTTTDIAVIVGGEPLYQRNGAVIGEYQTLVPALLTHSIGLGGDSEVHIEEHNIVLGPKRAGTAAALGGDSLTPTDAAIALGLVELGVKEKAIAVLKQRTKGKYDSWLKLAEAIIDAFAYQLSEAIHEMYQRLTKVPVYTVSEILAPKDIRPKKVIGLGAPATVFIPLVAKILNLPYQILPYSAGSNGIGAAAARPTLAISLHVDTEEESLIIPELAYREKIKRRLFFDRKQARRIAIEKLESYAEQMGLCDYGEIQIIEDEAFNVVRGFYTVGRIFSIKAQIRPAVWRVR